MNKPWLGYLSSFFILLAGILQFMAGKTLLGVLFTALAIIGVILKIYMARKQRDNEQNPS